MRERVTVTLKGELLEQVDRLVDGLTIRSRSQAMEYLLSKVLSDYRLSRALVLAGGQSRELSNKFLREIKGKPLLFHTLDYLHEFNISNFTVYLDFGHKKIRKALREKDLSYGISFLEHPKPAGTVEPLLKIRGEVKNTILVAYGDTICNLDLNGMLAFHKKNKFPATIALTTVSNPKQYGVVMLEGNKVKEFLQKPRKDTGSFLVNAGYYLLEPEAFRLISGKMRSLEGDFFPRLAEKGLLAGYPFQGLYINVNTQEDLEKARKLL